MKMSLFALAIWGISVSGALLLADEQPAPAKSWSVEIRYISAPESTLEEVNRVLDVKAFASAPPREKELGFEHLNGFRMDADDPGIHVVEARAVQEMQLPVTVAKLSGEQAWELIKHVQSHRQSDVLFAPKVVVQEGESVDIDNVTQRPFITGFTPHGSENDKPDGSENDKPAAKPQIQVIEEGTRFHVRVREIDSDYAQCDFRLTQTAVLDVRAMSTDKRASLVQVPEVAKNVVEFSAKTKDQQHILVWWPKTVTEVDEPVLGIARAVSFVGRKSPTEPMRLGVLITVTETTIEPQQP